MKRAKDSQLWDYVTAVLLNTAADMGLPRPVVRHMKKKWEGRFQGSCSERGVVRISLRNRFGKRFEPYQLIDTMAHELAHLKAFNHNPLWFSLHMAILNRLHNDGVFNDLRRLMKGKCE